MKRREAVRHLFVIGGSLWLLPQCKSGSTSEVGFFNLSEMEILTDISNTIIPPSGGPGAAELGIPQFIEKMIADCRSPEQQEKFRSGLRSFVDHVKNDSQEKWSALAGPQKQEMLKKMLAAKAKDNVRDTVKEIRDLTVTGYTNSEYFLTKVKEYKLVPGKYNGCVELNKKSI